MVNMLRADVRFAPIHTGAIADVGQPAPIHAWKSNLMPGQQVYTGAAHNKTAGKVFVCGGL